MANPHHHEHTDPQHGGKHGLPPVSPMQAAYPMPPVDQSHPQYVVYHYESGVDGPGWTSNPSLPHPYTLQLMPVGQQKRRPQLNVNMPMERVISTNTFRYPQPTQQLDQCIIPTTAAAAWMMVWVLRASRRRVAPLGPSRKGAPLGLPRPPLLKASVRTCTRRAKNGPHQINKPNHVTSAPTSA